MSCPPSLAVLGEIIILFLVLGLGVGLIIFLIINGIFISWYNIRLAISLFGQKKLDISSFYLKTDIYIYIYNFYLLIVIIIVFNNIFVNLL